MRHRDDMLQVQGQQLNRLRDTNDELVRASLQVVVEAIVKQLEAVERSVKGHVAAHTELHINLQLLTTIVGIGSVTAAKLLAEFSDLGQYERAKAAAADAGLTPSTMYWARRCAVVRGCPKWVRGIWAALYCPAITAI